MGTQLIFHIGQIPFIYHISTKGLGGKYNEFIVQDIFGAECGADILGETATVGIEKAASLVDKAFSINASLGAVFTVAQMEQQTVTVHCCWDDELLMLAEASLDRQKTKAQAMQFKYATMKLPVDELLLTEQRHVSRMESLCAKLRSTHNEHNN